MTGPLLATCDPDLLDELLRLSAAAGITLDIAHDPAVVLRSWSSAPVVLVGSDLAPAVAGLAPPRRSDVFLLGSVARGGPDWETALRLGATDVLELPAATSRLAHALADAADGRTDPGVVLGFVGGAGGVGTTSLACATALVAARETEVTLVDLDPCGPGVERLLDLDGGLGWHGLGDTEGRLGARALRDALPRRDGVAVLGWGGQQPTAVDWQPALEAAARGSGLVVVDLPRSGAPLPALVARCDHVVLVTRADTLGAASALRLLASLGEARSVALAVRPGSVPEERLAYALGVPYLVTVPYDRRLDEHVELGLGPVPGVRSPLAGTVRTILRRLT